MNSEPIHVSEDDFDAAVLKDEHYHLDPATITFFAMAIEVCDADMN